MSRLTKSDYVFVTFTILAMIIIAMKEITSFDEHLTMTGRVLFSLCYGYILFLNRQSKSRMLLIVLCYLVFMAVAI